MTPLPPPRPPQRMIPCLNETPTQRERGGRRAEQRPRLVVCFEGYHGWSIEAGRSVCCERQSATHSATTTTTTTNTTRQMTASSQRRCHLPPYRLSIVKVSPYLRVKKEQKVIPIISTQGMEKRGRLPQTAQCYKSTLSNRLLLWN